MFSYVNYVFLSLPNKQFFIWS